MKKYILTLFISFLLTGFMRAQLPCVANCSVYTVGSITYSLGPTGGTNVSLGDDQVSGAIPIGFTFPFMCSNYTNLYISSNGFISFNPSVSNGCCSGGFCPTVGGNPNNYIALAWTDLYPPGAGSIAYQTIGTSPNRICIVSYNGIPFCCSNVAAVSGQIRLYETTGVIEIHTTFVNCCNTKTQGIMNQAGTSGYPAPGYNSSNWTANNVGYRWTPQLGGPTAPAAILGNTSICPGVTTTYSVAPMAGALSYAWTLPAGWSGSSSTNTIAATPGATGVLSVTATYTCGTSVTTTLNVTVNPSPTVSIAGGTAAVCPGTSITLTGSGATSYTWVPGGPSNPIVITPTATGNWTLIGASAAGCTASAVKNITVNPTPTVSITGTNQICQGTTLLLTANGAASYTWNTGSLSSGISVAPTTNTTYSVIGILGPCPGTAAINVTVNPNPNVTIVGNNTVCAGTPINLLAGGANSYTWSTGALTPTISPTPSANITYTVYGSNTLTGCSNVAFQSVTVNAVPTLTLTGPNAMCVNQTITLNAFGGTTYSWSTGQTSQSITLSPPVGTVGINVIAYSPLGCASAPGVKNVTVNPIPVVGITGTETLICRGQGATITASGVNTYSWTTGALTASIAVSPTTTTTYSVVGTNTATGCYTTVPITIIVSPCTSIGELNSGTGELVIYPNPNSGEFFVEFKNGLKKDIDVYDIMGRAIITTQSEDDKIVMNISEYANGIYYVRIRSDEYVKIVRVVKQ